MVDCKYFLAEAGQRKQTKTDKNYRKPLKTNFECAIMLIGTLYAVFD